jgi:hypothetical protein
LPTSTLFQETAIAMIEKAFPPDHRSGARRADRQRGAGLTVFLENWREKLVWQREIRWPVLLCREPATATSC